MFDEVEEVFFAKQMEGSAGLQVTYIDVYGAEDPRHLHTTDHAA